MVPEAGLAPPLAGESAGDRAAVWLAEHGGTLQAAGERFGVTHQAVQRAWRKLYPGRPTPKAQRASDALAQALDLARSGVHVTEICRRMGLQRVPVQRACAAAGVDLTPGVRPADATERAVGLVAAGAFIADAAAETGAGYQSVAILARKRGVSRGRGRTRPEKDGRAMRAARRVLDGASMAEACRAERVAQPSVHVALRRLREA